MECLVEFGSRLSPQPAATDKFMACSQAANTWPGWGLLVADTTSMSSNLNHDMQASLYTWTSGRTQYVSRKCCRGLDKASISEAEALKWPAFLWLLTFSALNNLCKEFCFWARGQCHNCTKASNPCHTCGSPSCWNAVNAQNKTKQSTPLLQSPCI